MRYLLFRGAAFAIVAPICGAEIDRTPPYSAPTVSFPDMVTRRSQLRLLCGRGKRGREIVSIAIGLGWSDQNQHHWDTIGNLMMLVLALQPAFLLQGTLGFRLVMLRGEPRHSAPPPANSLSNLTTIPPHPRRVPCRISQLPVRYRPARILPIGDVTIKKHIAWG